MSTTCPTTLQTFTNPVNGPTHPNDATPVADGLDTIVALQNQVGQTTTSRSASGTHELRLNELFARAQVSSTAPTSPVTHDAWVDVSGTPYLFKLWTGAAWQTVGTTVTGMTNPLTTQDDLVVAASAGAPARLAKGADGQVLTVDPTTHHVVWAASASGFANPMIAQDDVIVGGTSGTGARLAKGTDGQVLTVDAGTHHLVWATPSALSNPMTTLNDLILGGSSGTPARLAKGADGQVLTVDPSTHAVLWANSASGFANPMVAQDDVIVGGTSGTGTRLAKGTDGQVLTVDPSTHHLVWATPSVGGTVSSVALTLPSWLSVSGSPVTTSGTLAVTATSGQTANQVLATPNGTTGIVGLRALVPADYPVFIASGGSHAAGAVPDPGSSSGTAKFLREDASWATPSGGGSASIDTGAYSSRPSAGTDGRLYLPTDGYHAWSDDGATWQGWGPLFPMTQPPAVAGWTQVGTTAAAAADSQGALYLEAAGGASAHMSALVRTVPATPYTVTACFLLRLEMTSFAQGGLCWYDGTKFDWLTIYATAAGVLHRQAGKSTDFQTFSASRADTIVQPSPYYWMRLRDDGATRYCDFGLDGQHWYTVTSMTRTDFLTPTHVGIDVDDTGIGGAGNAALLLLSWAVT